MRRLLLLSTALVIALLLVSCGQRKPVKKARPLLPWKLVSDDPTGGYGTYLGNGSIGVQLHAEGVGWHKGQELKCLMAGLYKDEALIRLPNFSDLPIYAGDQVADDKRFLVDADAPYEQTLDLRAGTLRTKCTLRQGRRTMDADTLFAVARDTDRVQIVAVLLPHFSGKVTTAAGPGKPADGFEAFPAGKLGLYGQQTGYRIKGQVEQVYLTTDLAADAKVAASRAGAGGTSRQLVLELEDGKSAVLRKTVSVSRGSGSIAGITADSAPKDTWGSIWKSRIEIEGDPEAQQAVNSCLFYLLQSVRRRTDYSIPPTGLSNDAWGGHIFWDADTWMFPALLPQYPELAKSIVDYRFKTLPGAIQNATSRKLKGAEYAWESARTGRETIGEPFRNERHITSDVALAQWQYFQATLDRKWLARSGYPVISACADYWVSRVKLNPVKDYYEILHVMPPDEDSDIIDNSVYTNASAKKTLEVAATAARMLGRPINPMWAKIAAKMYIPYDQKNDRFIEYPGFNKRMTKQADTELLIYPLEYPMAESTRARTFDYWAKKVNPKGPAMSSSVHAVIAARLNRGEEAYRYFTDSYKPFFRPPFNYFNEKRSQMYENMCFMTGAAGPVQAVIYGFCGLQYDGKGGFTISPHLPRKWKSVMLRNFQCAGKHYDIIVRQGKQPEIRRIAP